MTRKVYVKSFGCQMNVYDSERMKDVLAPVGYEAVDGPEAADLVILNTCHIREKAAEKVYSDLGRLRKIKDQKLEAGNGDMIVAVAGCVAQAEGEEIMRRAPMVKMVFGPQAYHRLPEMIARVERGEDRVLETDFPVEDKFDHLPRARANLGPSAFLTIQEGCDKFCTFCVVPYTRGAEYSRPVNKVLDEAKALVAGGVRELTLLGQNVNAYHGESASGGLLGLAELCHLLADIAGLERIRYTTSHPRDMDDALIAAHGNLPELMPYLHLPIQSGSDKILEAMNRQHTAESYIDLVAKIRTARPDIALSCDFIVGFPGETDADFEATLELIRKVTYAQAYSFKYSPRPGTPGAEMPNQVDEAIKARRLAILQDLLSTQQTAFNTACLGLTLPVLFEKRGRHEGQIIGRSPFLQAVFAQGSQELIGEIANVEVQALEPNSLKGHLVDTDKTAAAE